MAYEEPTIEINGVLLNSAQSMAVRVAVTNFHSEMADKNALGNDNAGRTITALYRARSTEVLQAMGVIK